MAISVLIVDDHPVVRTGLRAVLAATTNDDEVAVVGEAASGEEAMTLTAHLKPDVVLCDLRLGEGMDGIATTRMLRNLESPPAVLILTTFDSSADIVRAVEAGAAGYLLKDTDPGQIIAAIKTVASGGTAMPPKIAASVMRELRAPGPKLTQRETEVIELLATGATNQDIARALFVTEATVKSHLVRIFAKLDVDNRLRAVHIARQRGMISGA